MTTIQLPPPEAFKFIEVTPDYKTTRGAIFGYPGNYVQELKTIFENPNARAFKSVFLYDQSYQDFQQKNNGSTAGFTGACWADEVIFDFDDNESLENAHQSAKNVVMRLIRDFGAPVETMPIGFTGNRGFHLSIPQKLIGFKPSLHLRQEMIAFAEKVVEGCCLPTTKFDASIYKANGLIRVSGSCHEKTGLYKIMLTAKELIDMPIGDILEAAKARRPKPKYESVDEYIGVLAALWTTNPERIAERAALNRASRELPVLAGAASAHAIKTDQRMCIVKMMSTPLKEGEGRNEIAIRIASHFTNQGLPTDAVVGVMRGWNAGLPEPLPEYELDRTMQSAISKGGYYYPCSDVVLASFCDNRCYKYTAEVSSQTDHEHIKTARDIMKAYVDVLQEDRMITLGLADLDYYCHGVAPGEVVFQVGCSGVGKTTLMLFEAMEIRKKTGKPILILEQELHEFLIGQKLAALATERDPKDLERIFKDCRAIGNMERFNGIVNKIEERYDGVFFCTLDQLSTKRKIELIQAAQAKHGQFAAVFEDYLGRGSEFGRDLYEITTKLAMGSKTVAKTCNIPLFSMVQARSEDGLNASEPLTMNSVRDSRHIFIAGDIIIGWWRPFFSQTSVDNRLRGVILKNRRGFEGNMFDLLWDRASGTYSKCDTTVELPAGGH
jgi:hypothetical protein